jgi:hypothetical protein
LRNRELAIEAMKRKIEAKLRGQGVPSHDGIAQQIAVSIIDNQDDSLSNSPMVQSPESTRDAWISNTNSPSSSAPIPRSEVVNPESQKETSLSIPSPDSAIIATIRVMSPSNLESIPPVNEERQTEISAMEDDEEAQLLAELEAERLAEERARQKRRELEDRLANARGKNTQRITSIIPEGGGDGDHRRVDNPAQDSTSSLL